MNAKVKLKVFALIASKWRTSKPREQALVALASALLILALCWWTLVAPPLRVLRQAVDQQRSLDAERQVMQSLQAQAQRLLALPRIGRDDAIRALQASTKPLGTLAQLDVSGERVTLTLNALPSNALAQWLAQARINAYTQPLEARLTRANGPAAAWDGVLVLGLPAK